MKDLLCRVQFIGTWYGVRYHEMKVTALGSLWSQYCHGVTSAGECAATYRLREAVYIPLTYAGPCRLAVCSAFPDFPWHETSINTKMSMEH